MPAPDGRVRGFATGCQVPRCLFTASLLLLLLALAACNDPEAAEPHPNPAPAPGSENVEIGALLQEIDTGRPGPLLQKVLADTSSKAHLQALRAAVPLAEALEDTPWLRALASPEPSLREVAAHAFPLLPARPTEPILRAIAAEASPRLLGPMLRALGSADVATAAPFLAALDRDESDVLEGACFGLAHARLPASALPHAALARLLGPIATDPGDEDDALHLQPRAVRLACAYALTRLPAPRDDDAARGVAHDLLERTADPDPGVRLFALSALRRYPSVDPAPLARALDDPDWRVASAAYRAYVRHAPAHDFDARLRSLVEKVLARPALLEGSGLRVWEAALRAAAALPSDSERLAWAERQLEAYAESHLAGPPSTHVAAGHCELAAWVDAQRRWPGRLRACGDGFAPAGLVHFHEARLVAAQPSSPDLRATYLGKMLERGPEARISVAAAASRVRHTSLALPLAEILRGGSDADAGHAAQAALELSPLLRSDPALHARLVSALETRLGALPAAASVPSLLAFLEAEVALASPSPSPTSLRLASHPSPDVAEAAARRLATVMDPDERPRRPLPTAWPAEALPGPSRRVVLRLPRGEVEMVLDADVAPTAVARLAHALENGWLEGAPVTPHGGGEPEVGVGDPYATTPGEGPLWVRPNFTPGPCKRGTVLLVGAAPRSDSLALRVLLSRRPDLDGRATRVGRVVAGLEILEGVLIGDVVRDVQVGPAPPQPPRASRTDPSP